MVRSACHVKLFPIGCKSSLKGGHVSEIATEATVQRVEDLIQVDRRVTIYTIATLIGCSHSMAYLIMHDRLGFHKVCATTMKDSIC
jgi:hypothetical protein